MKWYKIRELSKELLESLLQPEGKELKDEQLDRKQEQVNDLTLQKEILKQLEIRYCHHLY